MCNKAWEAALYDISGDSNDSNSSKLVAITCKGVLAKIVGLGVKSASTSRRVVSICQSHDNLNKVEIVDAGAVEAKSDGSASLKEDSDN